MANQVTYGFLDLAHLFDKRVSEVGERVVYDAISKTVAEHNRQIDALLSLFTAKTTEYLVSFRQPGVARLQPGSSTSRARPIDAGSKYQVAFPMQKGDAALGIDWLTSQKITVAEANERAALLVSADMRWVRDHVLAALFANTTWSFTDPEHGALTIQGLANADTVKYQIATGADDGATDSHYLFQLAAIADATNPFPALNAELVEHPENSGEVVAFVPTNLKDAVKNLANFMPARDPNVQPGATSDILTGDLGIQTPGQMIGYVDETWIVWWRSMPSNYIIATCTGGERALQQREDEMASLRGFIRAGGRADFPYSEDQWTRMAGWGAYNRVGAAVLQIGAGAYSVPTNYTSPMP